jgi:hypothetical protein
VTPLRAAAALAIGVATSCASPGTSVVPARVALRAEASASGFYQPLAFGDHWSYVCHNTANPSAPTFDIANAVVGKTKIAGRTVYEFSIQIPSSPTASTKVTQLLADDAQGNTRIYGYLIHGKIKTIPAAVIVATGPRKNAYYDYRGPTGARIVRQFLGFESSNPTPLGTFQVAPYFESDRTHNYGYALKTGIVEEDHGPAYLYDCLIDHVVLL